MTIPDLSCSRAILVGNSTFADTKIPSLPAAPSCVEAMADLLTGELCGWPPNRVTRLIDIASPSELARRLLAAVKGVQDTVLLYYVGHGMRTSEGQLALALGDTEADPESLPHTASLYEAVAKILRGCPARTKLVILDCCHAELGTRANFQFQSADMAEAYPIDGLYFIGASKRHEKAKAPIGGGLTYFTSALLETVQDGIPGGPDMLRLDQIFIALRSRLLRANLPEPVESGARGARHYPFARNTAPPEATDDSPPPKTTPWLAFASVPPAIRAAWTRAKPILHGRWVGVATALAIGVLLIKTLAMTGVRYPNVGAFTIGDMLSGDNAPWMGSVANGPTWTVLMSSSSRINLDIAILIYPATAATVLAGLYAYARVAFFARTIRVAGASTTVVAVLALAWTHYLIAMSDISTSEDRSPGPGWWLLCADVAAAVVLFVLAARKSVRIRLRLARV